MLRPEELALSNGIPVVLQAVESPVAAIYWWVRTGSADESAPEAGFAHFLEHMLFKDAAAKETGKASTGQMARAIESLGGDINAYTSFDQTVYHVTCASQHWEKVIDSFGAMARPQRFLKSDFDREREVILEELRKNNDSPSRKLFQELFSATFKQHPYGRPVIGFEKTLKAAKLAKLEAFYKRQYASGNMGLVLVGPVDEKPGGNGIERKRLVHLLEKHFGKSAIPARSAPPRKRPQEKELRDSVTAVKTSFDIKTPVLAFSFRAPELRHADIPVLDVISSALSMGELSRLYQRLFYKSALATDVSGGLYVPSDLGMLYFHVELEDASKIPQAAEEAFDELNRLRREGPTSDELGRVIVNVESEKLYATQTADGTASRLGFLKYVIGDLDFDRGYLEELKSIDARRVREVCDRYFDYRRMNLAVMLPKGSADIDLKPLVERATRAFPAPAAAPAKSKSPAARAPGAGKPEVVERPSGMKVVYLERPHSQVVSVHAAALGGLRLELASPVDKPETDWGSSYMMSLTWTKGTIARDARAIASAIEGRAASLDGFSGRNTVGVQLTGLKRDWKDLSALFNEVLLEPTFPEDEVTHSRRVAEDAVRSIEDHSAQLCSKLFLETLFEKHPYGHLTTGSLDSLKAIDSSKLKAFHRGWIRPERLTVSVVGAVKRLELESWLTELEAKAAAISRAAQAIKLAESVAPEPPLRAPRWAEKHLGREQLHILVGGLGTTIHSSRERYPLRILQTLLSGQSGRLFIELREKKSLAYTVSPVHMEGLEPGYFGTYIACAPAKKDEAIAGIKSVLEKLASKGPTPAEMKRAKEFYLGRRAMDLQADSSLASHFGLEALYGIPLQEEREIAQQVAAVSARDVQETCRKYLAGPPMVTSIVG